MSEPTDRQVFLGGACGRTIWREKIAIPMFESAGVTYFNPQLGEGEWTPAREAIDIRAKNEAEVLLFVLGEETRGVATVGEVAYYIGLGRPLAISLRMIPDDATWVSDAERTDLNRGRIFVRSMAADHKVPVFGSVEEATAHVIEIVRERNARMTTIRAREILRDVRCGELRFEAANLAGELSIRIAGPYGWFGRWWHVPSSSSESDLVRTAFKAAVTWSEHETREAFLYRGRSVFGPHLNLGDLWEAASHVDPKS